MNARIFFVVVLFTVAFSSCKIQDAPGAYLPAKERVTVVDLKPEEPVEEHKVVPKPVIEPVIVVSDEPVEQPQFVEEPSFVEADVQIQEPEVSEEEKNVRSEKFEVVDNQDVVLLKFNVIIGSFSSKDNANNLQRQMRPEYSPAVVINERGLYRVVLKSYDTYSEAKAKVNDISNAFPDAWVLIKK